MNQSNEDVGTVLSCGHEVLDELQPHYCDYLSLVIREGFTDPFRGSSVGEWREPASIDEEWFVRIHQNFENMFEHHIRLLRIGIECLRCDTPAYAEARKRLRQVVALTKSYAPLMVTLRTMDPKDFKQFRDLLVPASGMESERFRIIELLSGVKVDTPYGKCPGGVFSFKDFLNRDPVPGEGKPKTRLWTKKLETVSQEPNLADTFRSLADTAGYSPRDVVERSIQPLGEIAKLLVEYEKAFLLFRARHISVTGYQIGSKTGTGFSTGVEYLSYVRQYVRFFPFF